MRTRKCYFTKSPDNVAKICQHSEGLINRARLEAARSPHSADWLNAMPMEACGLVLDNEAVRTAVGLKLGLSLCGPHRVIVANAGRWWEKMVTTASYAGGLRADP